MGWRVCGLCCAGQLPERAARAAEPAKKSLPFFGSTEYGDMHHDGFRLDDDTGDMAGYRPKPEDTGAFEGRTEAQMAYVAHPLEQGRRAGGAKSHGIGVGEGAFKGSTESREAFPGHVVSRVQWASEGVARPPPPSTPPPDLCGSVLCGMWGVCVRCVCALLDVLRAQWRATEEQQWQLLRCDGCP